MRAVLGLAAVLALAGCAGLAPFSTPASVAPRPAATTRAAATPAPAAATVDSTPSPEALAVLATIPEPLSRSERVPAAAARASHAAGDTPAPGATDSAAQAPRDSVAAAPADSAAAQPADTLGSGVPVPEPTLPIGERPGGAGQALPESAFVPSGPVHAEAARPDTCWRLQVGAPPEKAKAEALEAVASSQMLTPFVIELENKRYKVRTRDCMDRAAVNALRARAQRSGFRGVFVVRTPVKAPAKAGKP